MLLPARRQRHDSGVTELFQGPPVHNMRVMSQTIRNPCPARAPGWASTTTQHARRTQWVVALTLVMMVAEIVGGTYYGSMALVADGWHMATHAAALGIATLAYRYARRHADDPRFTFGTGKVGELAGFASAISLAIVALLIGAESVQRLLQPAAHRFPAGRRHRGGRADRQPGQCLAAAP